MSKISIIAEIGWNHMGDMILAENMISEAAKNGADMVKFQTWSEKNLKNGPWDSDGRREIYKKAELTKEKHIHLLNVSKKHNVEFLTSIFSLNQMNLIKELGIQKIKVPSHEVHNLELIKALGNHFDKVFVSTGAAKWSEVLNIPKIIDKKKLVLFHCVSSYPCHIENINLTRLNALKKLSEEVGYSGHFQGVEDAIGAIGMGAHYIEKHFTINNSLPGRDNEFAILPHHLKTIADFRDLFEKMTIDKGLDHQASEQDIIDQYRGRWNGSN